MRSTHFLLANSSLTDGYNNTEEMRHLLARSIEEVPKSFSFLRWVGDMTWSCKKMATSETLMQWESACNIVPDAPAVFLCQYELSQFSGDVVIDALKTHPLTIIGSIIHQNPYYEDPEVFLDQIRNRAATPLVQSGE